MCCVNVTVNEKHKTPMIGWRKACTLKDYLVRAKRTKTPKNLKVLDVMVNVARFASILRRHVSLKTLMGISTIFERGLSIATQILMFINFIVAPVLNNT